MAPVKDGGCEVDELGASRGDGDGQDDRPEVAELGVGELRTARPDQLLDGSRADVDNHYKPLWIVGGDALQHATLIDAGRAFSLHQRGSALLSAQYE
jgi:hypothetical protein